MNDIVLKPCPFCGGNAKLSFKDYRFCWQNDRGDKKLQYRVQVICNRCRSRGKPIITEPLLNSSPYSTTYYMGEDHEYYGKNNETFEPYFRAAAEAWNTRTERSEE